MKHPTPVEARCRFNELLDRIHGYAENEARWPDDADRVIFWTRTNYGRSKYYLNVVERDDDHLLVYCLGGLHADDHRVNAVKELAKTAPKGYCASRLRMLQMDNYTDLREIGDDADLEFKLIPYTGVAEGHFERGHSYISSHLYFYNVRKSFMAEWLAAYRKLSSQPSQGLYEEVDMTTKPGVPYDAQESKMDRGTLAFFKMNAATTQLLTK